MSYCQRAIVQDTGEPDPKALATIEEHMRSEIVHSTLVSVDQVREAGMSYALPLIRATDAVDRAK